MFDLSWAKLVRTRPAVNVVEDVPEVPGSGSAAVMVCGPTWIWMVR
jgi:hypothetical protein